MLKIEKKQHWGQVDQNFSFCQLITIFLQWMNEDFGTKAICNVEGGAFYFHWLQGGRACTSSLLQKYVPLSIETAITIPDPIFLTQRCSTRLFCCPLFYPQTDYCLFYVFSMIRVVRGTQPNSCVPWKKIVLYVHKNSILFLPPGCSWTDVYLW